jgi:putative ABC transport system permease protein
MFRLNLKIALRNLLKYKVYTLINVLGLSIGMASCILIFIFIRFQLSYDQVADHQDRIYRFVTNWKYNSYTDNSSGSPIPFAPAAKNELNGIEKIARISRGNGVILVKDAQGREHFKAGRRVFFAEPDLLEIFNIQWLSPKPGAEFYDPNTVVLAESVAKTFFGGTSQAIGKSFRVFNTTDLKVIGVFKDQPVASSMPLDIVISFKSFWLHDDKTWDAVSSGSQVFALLKKGNTAATVQPSLNAFNKKYFGHKEISGNQTSVMQPLGDVHFDPRYKNFGNTSIAKKEIYGLAIIGLFLLVTACINFINLATAQAVNRSKEVGVRKAMGAMRKQLVTQFLTETFTVTVIALLMACIYSELALPVMENLFKDKVMFSLFKDPVIFVFMAMLVVLVSFLAGFYPAMIMSGFSAASAIKNKVTVNRGSLSLRQILVVLQFSVTIILMISTLVIMKQLQYVREKPLGFNSEAVAILPVPGDSASRANLETFKTKVLQVPGVQQLSYGSRAPLSSELNSTNFSFNGQENKDFEVTVNPADENYFRVFDLRLIAGKVFAKSDTLNGFIVNETFIKKVGLTDPEAALGKIIGLGTHSARIVGVMKDFNDRSLHEPITPMVCYQQKTNYWMAAIKLDQHASGPAMKAIESLWKAFFPHEVYEAKLLAESLNTLYETEQIMGFLFRVFAGVIIFISFIGLFGLISFVATQRTKEVAIRKVLGASTFQLVALLNGSFILMVFIANLVAWPLAYIFVAKWLSTFAYRMELSIWPFLLAMCISMLITLITVSIRSYQSAAGNAVNALKYE